MIYFDKDKQAYGFEITNPIATIDDELWSQYAGTDKWDIVNGEFIDITDTKEYQEKQAQAERERIAHLSLTRGDVFRGLLQARGVTRLMLRGMIESNEQLTEVQKEMALIDFDEALNFYRGNALIDTVGLALGIEPSQLDCFFETNDYKELISEPDVNNSEP